MRHLKSNALLALFNSYIVDHSRSPFLSYLGFFAGLLFAFTTPLNIIAVVSVFILFIVFPVPFIAASTVCFVTTLFPTYELDPDTLCISVGMSATLKAHIDARKLIPLYTFENLSDTQSFSAAQNTVAGLGKVVYGVVCLVTGDIYIGSSKVPHKRIFSHLVRLDGSSMVAQAVRLYGLGQFAFIIIALPGNVSAYKLRYIEHKQYIEILKPEYNITIEFEDTPKRKSWLKKKEAKRKAWRDNGDAFGLACAVLSRKK